MDQNIERITTEIAGIIEECDRDVARIAARSQEIYKRNMPAGATVPRFGTYDVASDADREAVRSRAGDAYRAIQTLIERDHAAYMRSMSEPATADDVATVQLTLSREHVTEEELTSLLDRYGTNHQLKRAILEKGLAMGYAGLSAGSPASDVEAALSRAAGISSRYDRGVVMMPATMAAESILDGYLHRDLFGSYYA